MLRFSFLKSTMFRIMHKLFLSSLVAVAMLSACGGDGSDSQEAPLAATPAQETTPAPAPTPTTTTPTLVEAPAAPNGMTLSLKSYTHGSSGTSAVVNFTTTTNLKITGNLNSFWISAAEAGGTVSIDGESNTLVLRPTATPTTVSVVGSANTVYLPEGSPISLTGSGAAMSSVKYYKP